MEKQSEAPNGQIPNIPNNENEVVNNVPEIPLKEQLLKEYGFYANINGEDFDPREVTVLSGDEKNREITQIIKFLFDSYPVEAINYCLQRCYYKTFSRCSLLDKIMKYLLEKHKDNGDQTINQLIWSYQENTLNIDISTVKDFNDMNKQNFGNSELHMTKLVFYDYSKEGVEYKKFNIGDIEESLDKNISFNIGKTHYNVELIFFERYYKVSLQNDSKLTTEKFIHKFLLFYEFLI